MVEGRSCLVSRRFSSSSHQQINEACMSGKQDSDNGSIKRQLFDNSEDNIQPWKLFKLSDMQEQNQRTYHINHGENLMFPEISLDLHEESTKGLKIIPCDDAESREEILQHESDNNRHAGDSSDADALIHSIGRDNSISCLLRCSRSDYGSLASLNRSFRSLIRSGDIYKLRRQSGLVEHWIYFSCDSLEWVAFDPTCGRWMYLPRMISDECLIVSDKESLAVGTQLLVFTTYVIYRYSVLTNSWCPGTPMNTPRCLFGSASLEEIAIVAGGWDQQRNILSSAELYNSETQQWEVLPNMNKPRKMCSAVFMNGKFYVIGGIGGPESTVLTCGEEYDLKTRTWTEILDMAPVRAGAAREVGMPPSAEAPPLIAAVNNELYAADYANMEVMKYIKESRTWLTVGNLPERAASMYGWGIAFRACGDSLVVIGGPRALHESFIELNSWVPKDGPPQWNLLASKRSSSFVHNCAVMGC